MRTSIVAIVLIASASFALDAAAAPGRKPLGPKEREAILALIKAVDLAQETEMVSEPGVGWTHHILKGGRQSAYVPFRLTLPTSDIKQPVVYVRAVSRHDGLRARDERSTLRDWILHGSDIAPRMPETVYVAPGDMPLGGPAVMSSKQSTAQAAAASAALNMQQRQYEKEKAAAEAAKKKEESNERDPLLFPFEEYYLVDVKPGAPIERALAVPPGEYDVFAAIIDRGRVKTSGAIVARHTVVVPDFWADQLALSSLILARDVHTLKAPLAGAQQSEHPYTFGQAEVVPVAAAAFTPDDALTVVYQICNYGAPDADLTAEYTFYRTDGARRVFNHTNPQNLSDADLPAPGPWETAAFTTESVALASFPPGQYELEVSVRDRLTRATAKAAVAFTVSSGVR
jgi:hypothetical protein